MGRGLGRKGRRNGGLGGWGGGARGGQHEGSMDRQALELAQEIIFIAPRRRSAARQLSLVEVAKRYHDAREPETVKGATGKKCLSRIRPREQLKRASLEHAEVRRDETAGVRACECAFQEMRGGRSILRNAEPAPSGTKAGPLREPPDGRRVCGGCGTPCVRLATARAPSAEIRCRSRPRK
eukprot:6184042-Pleurochrysis_carterae.AAC.3